MQTGMDTTLEIITYTLPYSILPNRKNRKQQHITILPFSLIASTATQMGIYILMPSVRYLNLYSNYADNQI
jgi:hypothetical protein